MKLEYNTTDAIEKLISKLNYYNERGVIENISGELLSDYQDVGDVDENGYATYELTGHSEMIIKIKIDHNLAEANTY